MLEREISGEVLKRIRDDPNFSGCSAIEIKVAKGNTLPKNALKPHQRRALILASTREICWKISDQSMEQKPFDGFVLKRSDAFVVIVFASLKETWAIPIQKFPEGAVSLDLARSLGSRVSYRKI
jgi:hypothetical protein